MVDLHPLQISPSNSLYFAQNRRFCEPISAPFIVEFVQFGPHRHCRSFRSGTAVPPALPARHQRHCRQPPSRLRLARPPPAAQLAAAAPPLRARAPATAARSTPKQSLRPGHRAPPPAAARALHATAAAAAVHGQDKSPPARAHLPQIHDTAWPCCSSRTRPNPPEPPLVQAAPISPGQLPPASPRAPDSSDFHSRKKILNRHCRADLTGTTGRSTTALPLGTYRHCRPCTYAVSVSPNSVPTFCPKF
jgi:hypothetical protein